jgi:hypothetical protein
MFDHMIVFGEAHLRRILGAFAAYYNKVRVHRSCTATAASLCMIRADTPPGFDHLEGVGGEIPDGATAARR